MARITYLRVSTFDQSVEAQRSALGVSDREFVDEGVSGGILAADRPGFAALLKYVREGDTVAVYAVDRLGRDGLDVHATVKALMDRGVRVEVLGLGVITEGVGVLVLTVLGQIAEMEKKRIAERCEAGRQVARVALAETGRTHRGAVSLGRPHAADPGQIRAWRSANFASISATAEHFSVSVATVKRACAGAAA